MFSTRCRCVCATQCDFSARYLPSLAPSLRPSFSSLPQPGHCFALDKVLSLHLTQFTTRFHLGRPAHSLFAPQRAVAGGCHLNRDTADAIDAAFADGDVTQYRFDLLPGKIAFSNGFSLDNPGSAGAGLIAPHVSGEATAGDCVLTRCPPRVAL